MKLHRFKSDWFDVGRVKYHAGLAYKPDEHTTLAVAQGHAEEVDLHEKHAAHPYVDPRQIEARKSALRRTIAEAEAELAKLEDMPIPAETLPPREGAAHGARHDDEAPAAAKKDAGKK